MRPGQGEDLCCHPTLPWSQAAWARKRTRKPVGWSRVTVTCISRGRPRMRGNATEPTGAAEADRCVEQGCHTRSPREDSPHVVPEHSRPAVKASAVPFSMALGSARGWGCPAKGGSVRGVPGSGPTSWRLEGRGLVGVTVEGSPRRRGPERTSHVTRHVREGAPWGQSCFPRTARRKREPPSSQEEAVASRVFLNFRKTCEGRLS